MVKKKKKKGNSLLILLLVLVVLIAGYFGVVKYVEYSDEKAIQESLAEEEANTPYLNKIDAFVAVSYTNQTETLHFTLDQETSQWSSTEVPDFPVSSDSFSVVAGALEMLAGQRKLENVTEEDLEEYGLDSPAYTVEAQDADGNVFTMYIGGQNATTGDYYAQVEGENATVYTISSDLVSYLEYGLYDLIQMETYPSITEDTLQKLEFISETGSIAMERQEEETETEEETESQTAEEETVQWSVTGDAAADDLISMVSQISFDSCVDYKVTEDTRETYGFDDPAGELTVTYTTSSGDVETVTLTIGGYDEETESYYCLMNDSAMVNLVSASAFSTVITQ